MKRIIKVTVLLVILCGIAVFIGYRVDKVNKEYGNGKTIEYHINDTFSWNSYDVKVKGYEFTTFDQIKEKYGDKTTISSRLEEEDVILVATIDVTYNGDKESAVFPITSIGAVSAAWANASDFSLLSSMNQEMKCKKGETMEFYLPYPVCKVGFSPIDWKNYKNRKYELTFTTYPDVVKVDLY